MGQIRKTDVLIVGGGPAGIGAAIAAARKGADTLLIENQAFFGGIPSALSMWAFGVMSVFLIYCAHTGIKRTFSRLMWRDSSCSGSRA